MEDRRWGIKDERGMEGWIEAARAESMADLNIRFPVSP
jgi:hypothetical protein